MTVEQLLKKAGGREAIIKLASALEKKANTQFNETVPAVAAPTQNETASNSQVSGAADPAMVAQGAGVDPNAAPAVDPNAMPVDQGIDPGMEGALAAQSFLAPIMEAAMNGDPNAQAIIAQAAGSIAKGVAEAAAGVSSAAPMPAPVAAAAPIVSAATPEDQVADAIVPEQKPEDKAPPAKDEGQEKKASFTASQIKGLLDLARAGKI